MGEKYFYPDYKCDSCGRPCDTYHPKSTMSFNFCQGCGKEELSCTCEPLTGFTPDRESLERQRGYINKLNEVLRSVIEMSRLCPDKDCIQVHRSGGGEEYVNNGGSFVCWGKLKEPHIIKFKNTTHTNDLCFCTFAPVKGIIRMLINRGDIRLIERGFKKLKETYR